MPSVTAVTHQTSEAHDLAIAAVCRRFPNYDTPRKQENLERLRLAEAEQRLVVDAAPPRLRLEPSAHCNLRCCWAQRNPQHPDLRPRGFATPELAREIVRQVGDTLYMAELFHWGEPTLNRDLPELVRTFHDAHIHTSLHTNMLRMTADLAGALCAAGLDGISASIDGATQETYGEYRKGGQLADALRGLEHLVRAREQRGAAHPGIRWQFLVFPHTVDEVEHARRLAQEIGVDSFTPMPGGPWRYDPQRGLLPPAQPERPSGLLCTDPWRYLAVDWDGAVHLCCKAFRARDVVGDLRQAPLRAIFDGPRVQLARRVIRDGLWQAPDGPIPCTGCNRVKQHVPEVAALGHVLTLD